MFSQMFRFGRDDSPKSAPIPSEFLLDNFNKMNTEDFDSSSTEEEDFSDPEYNREQDEDFVIFTNQFKKRPRAPKPIPSLNLKRSKKKIRICDFCGTSETPMWRKGPQGKGTLCNACGVKWSLKIRKRSKKKDSRELDTKKTFRTRQSSLTFSLQTELPPILTGSATNEVAEKEYQCRYCNARFPAGHFRNTQQFGAHCSNCSRKHRNFDEGEVSTKEKTNRGSTPSGEKVEQDGKMEDSSISDCANELIGLLSVVEKKLLEENSIEEIKLSLSRFKSEVLRKENDCLQKIEELRREIGTQILLLKDEVLSMDKKINKIESAFQQVEGVYHQVQKIGGMDEIEQSLLLPLQKLKEVSSELRILPTSDQINSNEDVLKTQLNTVEYNIQAGLKFAENKISAIESCLIRKDS